MKQHLWSQRKTFWNQGNGKCVLCLYNTVSVAAFETAMTHKAVVLYQSAIKRNTLQFINSRTFHFKSIKLYPDPNFNFVYHRKVCPRSTGHVGQWFILIRSAVGEQNTNSLAISVKFKTKRSELTVCSSFVHILPSHLLDQHFLCLVQQKLIKTGTMNRFFWYNQCWTKQIYIHAYMHAYVNVESINRWYINRFAICHLQHWERHLAKLYSSNKHVKTKPVVAQLNEAPMGSFFLL